MLFLPRNKGLQHKRLAARVFLSHLFLGRQPDVKVNLHAASSQRGNEITHLHSFRRDKPSLVQAVAKKFTLHQTVDHVRNCFHRHGVPPGNVFRKLPENVLAPSAGIIDVIALIAVGDVEQALIDIWPEHAEFLPHTSQLGIAEQSYISRPPVQRNFTISARSITSGFQGRKGGVAALCLACLRQNDNVLAELLRNVMLEPVADICDSLTLPCIRVSRKERRLHLIAGLANTEHERTFRLLNLSKGAVRRQHDRVRHAHLLHKRNTAAGRHALRHAVIRQRYAVLGRYRADELHQRVADFGRHEMRLHIDDELLHAQPAAKREHRCGQLGFQQALTRLVAVQLAVQVHAVVIRNMDNEAAADAVLILGTFICAALDVVAHRRKRMYRQRRCRQLVRNAVQRAVCIVAAIAELQMRSRKVYDIFQCFLDHFEYPPIDLRQLDDLGFGVNGRVERLLTGHLRRVLHNDGFRIRTAEQQCAVDRLDRNQLATYLRTDSHAVAVLGRHDGQLDGQRPRLFRLSVEVAAVFHDARQLVGRALTDRAVHHVQNADLLNFAGVIKVTHGCTSPSSHVCRISSDRL
nr:MAG TPA: hypothetical protein [Bacteriophage sp.]